jgi:hypothetical protein
MSSKNTGDSGRRYSDICGATNNRGEPCKLPAGWGTPGSATRGRCKFHGGGSTGPSDTEHLEDNSYAEGNAGGGAPEGNTNAEIHGGFADWEKAYERFDEGTRDYVALLISDMRETAKEHAPEVDAERREQLLKEKATLSILWDRAAADTLGTPKDPVEGSRGFVIEERREHGGETYTVHKANPALQAGHSLRSRKREIAKELRLRPGFQDD